MLGVVHGILVNCSLRSAPTVGVNATVAVGVGKSVGVLVAVGVEVGVGVLVGVVVGVSVGVAVFVAVAVGVLVGNSPATVGRGLGGMHHLSSGAHFAKQRVKSASSIRPIFRYLLRARL